MVGRVEAFDLAGADSAERRCVERSHRRDAARAGFERAKELGFPKPYGAYDSDTGNEYAFDQGGGAI